MYKEIAPIQKIKFMQIMKKKIVWLQICIKEWVTA